MTIIVIVALSTGMVVIGISAKNQYNSLISKERYIELEWNNVKKEYMRQADIVSHLASIAKGTVKGQESVLETVTVSNDKAAQSIENLLSPDSKGYKDFIKYQKETDDLLQNYLDATANNQRLNYNERYQTLLARLDGCQHLINLQIKKYNISVTSYNKTVDCFPTSIFARFFDFKEKPLIPEY